MKLVIFGATGNVGQRITKEALDRGHEVVAVVRDPARSEAPDHWNQRKATRQYRLVRTLAGASRKAILFTLFFARPIEINQRLGRRCLLRRGKDGTWFDEAR